MSTKTNEPITYQIHFPERKKFNTGTGEWEPVKPYTTPEWVRYGEKVLIMNGEGSTDDIQIALELVDAGAIVTPDPRPIWQEIYAAQLKSDAEANPIRLAELARYVNDANAWRAKNKLKPLSIPAPDVPRTVSALLMPVPQVQ